MGGRFPEGVGSPREGNRSPVDRQLLILVHPAADRDKNKPERIQPFPHLVSLLWRGINQRSSMQIQFSDHSRSTVSGQSSAKCSAAPTLSFYAHVFSRFTPSRPHRLHQKCGRAIFTPAGTESSDGSGIRADLHALSTVRQSSVSMQANSRLRHNEPFHFTQAAPTPAWRYRMF